METKLFKTRLCHLYQRGGCHRQYCSFAHGEAELRRFLHGKHRKRRYDDGHSDRSLRATGGTEDKLRKLRSEINLYISSERDRILSS